ncbi:hypothetical protein AB0L41_43255 [Amycolatopsis mediterranei]|uniref:hypothetical protein n=1 Tax=Amycolatopsis mediterranei TaxID=33910 RepID=UPI003432F1BD
MTAEPFTRTIRTPVTVPPLRVGIACDVSGSMGWARAHVASAAWILANAARHTRVPADTASVIFGHHVRPLTHPGKPPAEVTEFRSNDNYEDIPARWTPSTAPWGCPAPARPGWWSSCPTASTAPTLAAMGRRSSTGCARPDARCCG